MLTLHAALSLIAPAEACILSLRVMKHADGRLDRPKLVATTDAGSWVAESLDDLVALATRGRGTAEADLMISELETTTV